MAEPAPSDSSPDTDRDFDPTADMLVHDYDDEHTMEEEEALSNAESVGNELANLEKEGDMPIEELLAMYYGGQGGSPPGGPDNQQDTRSSSEEEILSNQDLTLDKEEIARDLLKHEDVDNETSVNELLDSVEMPSQTIRLLRSSSQPGSSDDDSEDIDYEPPPDDDWKKNIQVGSDYQAVVPQGLSTYGDEPAYENEDRLLWCPFKLDDDEVEKYLNNVQTQTQQTAQGVQSMPQGCHVRDDEQALYLLLQCGHNVEEASRRRKMQTIPPTDPMSLWSEEECRNFENGLKQFGKDFYLIQQYKVKTRSVGELVQFYYLWKKTERHDVFANKTRLEKKKYALHPGVTDYMDRFLDEQENPAPPRDRSSSPNINSLLYGDPKRHMTDYRDHPTDLDAALDMVQKVVDTNALALSPLKLHAPDPQQQSAVAVGSTVSFGSDAGSSAHQVIVPGTTYSSVGFTPIMSDGDMPSTSGDPLMTSSATTCSTARPLAASVHSTEPSAAIVGTSGTQSIITDSIESPLCTHSNAEAIEPTAKRLKTSAEWSVNNSDNSVMDAAPLQGDVLSNQLVTSNKTSDLLHSCEKRCPSGDSDLTNLVDNVVVPKDVIYSGDKFTSMAIGLSGINTSLKTDFSSIAVRDSAPPTRSVPTQQTAGSAVQ